VTLSSAGAAASAGVAGSPYAITPSAASGSGLGNYTIGFVNGTLTVNPAALTITASGQAKTYGQTAALGTTAFTTSGLVNSDTVSGVTLSSTGAVGTAGAGTYAIVPGSAVGTGLSNYTIGYVNGTLTVNPAVLTARLTGTIGKDYDATTVATLAPSNYTLSGLIGGDSVILNAPSLGNYATPNVGISIPVTVTGLSLAGIAAGNYALTSTAATANIGEIFQLPPTIELIITQPQPVGSYQAYHLPFGAIPCIPKKDNDSQQALCLPLLAGFGAASN
jgi:hypothetical protein